MQVVPSSSQKPTPNQQPLPSDILHQKNRTRQTKTQTPPHTTTEYQAIRPTHTRCQTKTKTRPHTATEYQAIRPTHTITT